MLGHGKIEKVRLLKSITKYQQRLKTIPRRYWIIGGVLVGILLYSLIFFIPKQATFAYSGETCARQFILFPSIQAKKSDTFDVEIKDTLSIGSFTYGATKVCFSPTQAPKQGNYRASVGMFGGWFMAKQFAIKVSSPPEIQGTVFKGDTISTALPLRVPLTMGDTTHTYTLTAGDQQTSCEGKDDAIECAVSSLGLHSETEYAVQLMRSFKGDSPTMVAEGTVTTLAPLHLQQGSVSEGTTLYDMPKSFTFTFDKPLKDASAVLEQKGEGGMTTLETKVQVEGTTVKVAFEKELPRKTAFALTLKQVVAETGNSLEAPIVTAFSTSGGPAPRDVSVGNSGVAQSAAIVVTLDQPLKEGVDITKVARVEGVSGSVELRSATEIVYTIRGGLCTAFSLVLDKGVPSGVNNELSEVWKFDSRTICGTSAVIGYSAKGRAIVAYYFGNGSKTVLFTGGMHGSEPSGYSTMQAWVQYLMAYGYKIPADTRVVIVPNTNPDGIAAGSRNSATNVNIGRNFPTANWKADIETTSGVLVNGGGTSAGSEPESKALIALTRQLRPRLEVSFHAQGRLVGANKYSDSVAIGNIYASMVGYQTMFYDAEAVMGYPMTGEYEDWMGEEMGIPAILIELPSPSGNYLSSQLNALLRMLSV